MKAATMLRKRRRLVVVGAGIAIVTAVFLLSILVPAMPHNFSMNGAKIADAYQSCTGIDTVKGSTISFHWSAPSFAVFFVVSCSADQLSYEGNGTSGSGTITSVGGIYMFGGSCPNESFCVPANVSGTYTGPLLSL